MEKITAYNPDTREEISIQVAVERQIDLFINGSLISRIMCTPADLKELGIGYVTSEGILSISDIERVELLEDGLDITASNFNPDLYQELRSSGCIGVSWDETEDLLITSPCKFPLSQVKSSLDCLNVPEYTQTHGYHVACLFNRDGSLIARRIDVGRHNAVDKVIGAGILSNTDMSSCFLTFSGRISRGIALKCVRLNIPLLVSKASLLDSAVEVARKSGLSIVSFCGELPSAINPEKLIH